eukprot:TRINITY_DN5111_c0_g2_i1.p2 TRINITY_DN5111_c0_g2~~TRINITY_DN5111_c0_g2_i1.p2  ORF type:complete len:105 (-),score=21.11 TRINITY_DN5111_c0_g2_i1:82-396(-)
MAGATQSVSPKISIIQPQEPMVVPIKERLKEWRESVICSKEMNTQAEGVEEECTRKGQRVRFKDDYGEKIAEIQEVESYKEYNRIEAEKEASCCCTIVCVVIML